ncbi:hypothetical protein F4861DRAFT_350572 [Xylaria intraflava]|nr:hypothetical protein F4861DRAFT_350572 [Xylaria intraflava]
MHISVYILAFVASFSSRFLSGRDDPRETEPQDSSVCQAAKSYGTTSGRAMLRVVPCAALPSYRHVCLSRWLASRSLTQARSLRDSRLV